MKKEDNKGKIDLEAGSQLPPAGMSFDVPKDYFNGLTADITRRIDVLENPEGLKNTFQVPESYFSELPGVIHARINRLNEVPAGRQIQFHTTWRTAISIAAIFVFGVFIYRLSFPEIVVPAPAYSSITPQEIQESYIFEDIDEGILSEVSGVEYSPESNNYDEVKNYLIENQIDLSSVDIDI